MVAMKWNFCVPCRFDLEKALQSSVGGKSWTRIECAPECGFQTRSGLFLCYKCSIGRIGRIGSIGRVGGILRNSTSIIFWSLILFVMPRQMTMTMMLKTRHLPFYCFAAVSCVGKFSSAWALPHRGRTITATAATLQQKDDYHELPLDFPRREDVLVALAAVRQAARVTNFLQPTYSHGMDIVTKGDASPVTVADFAAQAVVLRQLKQHFIDDSFIAEESSQALDQDLNLAVMVTGATMMVSTDLVKQSIDLGKEYEFWNDTDNLRPPRVWCLDPIDGTKGFLRGRREGGQYCVALALLEHGIPTIGIMACPNLPAQPDDFDYVWNDEETQENNQCTRGCIFVASQGGGCYQLPLVPGTASALPIHVTPNDGSTLSPGEARFCIGVEKFSDALGQCAEMAKVLHGPDGVTVDGEIINARRIDSMAKYGVMARAGAELYARLPKPGYLEWIWDHAAGYVVITEAGGRMTDTNGDDIDFSLGAKMSDKVKGVLGSNGGIFHEALVNAFQIQEVARLKRLETTINSLNV